MNGKMQKEMQIKIDYNNMMADFIGEQGFTDKDLSANKKIAEKAFNDVAENRGTGMMGWTELPYNQTEIVKDIIDTAKVIRKNCDNFVVLGIGGSALGPIAVFQSLCHLRHLSAGALGRGHRDVHAPARARHPRRDGACLRAA